MFKIYLNLGDSIPSTTDWIQAACAIIIVFVTIKAYREAKKEVENWKNQKHYDLYINLKGLRHQYTRTLTKSIVNTISNIESNSYTSLSDLDKIDESLFNELMTLNYYYNIQMIDELEKSNNLLYSDIIDWYKKYDTAVREWRNSNIKNNFEEEISELKKRIKPGLNNLEVLTKQM